MSEKQAKYEAGNVGTREDHVLVTKFFTADGFDMHMRSVFPNMEAMLDGAEVLQAWLSGQEASPEPLAVRQAAAQAQAAAAQPQYVPPMPQEPEWHPSYGDAGSAPMTQAPIDYCVFHRAKMTPKSRQGDTWYSHKDGSSWCRGKDAQGNDYGR